MLSERRKKVIYSNPRGTLWANDDKKFGQKLLKSMGWQEGKGLGKNENGITENVKASFKFDSQGFGYKRNLNHWIEENNVYEQLLEDLAQHHTGIQGVSPKALSSSNSSDSEQTQKLKLNRKHHHRTKFIRAKNQSMQSQKDLFCIFPTSKESIGPKDSAKNDGKSSEMENRTEAKPVEELKPSTPLMKTVERKLTIEEYFKEKMKSKLKKTSAAISPPLPVSISQEDPGQTFIKNSEDSPQPSESKRKKKKRKKSNHAED